MSSKTAWILACAGVLIAGVIGWFIYKSSKTVSDASTQAAAAGGTALGQSLVQQARQELAGVLGLN